MSWASDETGTQAITRALADPQRYRILRLLAQSGQNTPCAALFDAVAIAPATLSHHMKELCDAGLVHAQRTGRTIQYTLRREALQSFLKGVERDLLPPED